MRSTISNKKIHTLSSIALLLSLSTYAVFFPFVFFGIGTDFYLNNYVAIQIFYLVSQISATLIAILVYKKSKSLISILALSSTLLFCGIYVLIKIMGLLMFGVA